MGAKTGMLVLAERNARDALAAKPVLDREVTQRLVDTLFPGEKLEPIGDGDICFEYPPDNEVHIGCFRGVSVVAAKEFVSDYAASKAFFAKALEPLGVKVGSEGVPRYGVELCSTGETSLCLFQTVEKSAHLHLAFTAQSREQVDVFYRAALEAGGTDHGAPHDHPNRRLRACMPGWSCRTILSIWPSSTELPNHDFCRTLYPSPLSPRRRGRNECCRL